MLKILGMKIKKYLLICLTFFFVIACSSDDDKTPIIDNESNLEVSNSEVILDADNLEDQEVEILDGAGGYKAFATNPDIVDVELNNSTLLLKGKKVGATKIIVQDVDNQLATITVKFMHTKLSIEETDLHMVTWLGTKKSIATTILSGNGGYSVEVEDNKGFVNASLLGNIITITTTGKEKGQAKIIVRDKLGLETVITVNVEVTEEAFTDELIESIKAEKQVTYVYNKMKLDELNPLKEKSNNMFLYGWEYNSWGYVEYYKVWINGDLTVGEKANSKFAANTYDVSTYGEVELERCEIIKNDGEKIWCIFSGEKDQTLHFGYFITTIK